MLATVYKGRPAALEIAGDQFTAIYETERVPIASGLAVPVYRLP